MGDFPEPQPTKLFKITVRIKDESNAPPVMEQEVIAYDITNETQSNFVLRKQGDTGKGRINLPKIRVHSAPGKRDMIIRHSITIGDDLQLWVAAETYVYGNVDMHIGVLKNYINNALTTVKTRAKRIQDTIEQE